MITALETFPEVAVAEQPPILVTKRQAMSMLQVSETKLDEWLAHENFPAIRSGHFVRILIGDVPAWIRNNLLKAAVVAQAPEPIKRPRGRPRKHPV